jgi:hypothetical protein
MSREDGRRKTGVVQRVQKNTKSVHALILARHDRLPVGNHPTLNQVKDALAWRALGVESSEPFSRNAVLKLFLSRLFGVEKLQEPDKALEQRATKAVGASRTEANELQTAMIRRWMDDLEAVPLAETPKDVPAEPKTAAAVKPPNDDGSFAARVLAAARTSKTGRFGDSKVFISHVFRKLVNEGAFQGDSKAFKNQLLSAHFRGLLSLGRADLVEAMKPEDVDASETEHDGSTFHFVLTRE